MTAAEQLTYYTLRAAEIIACACGFITWRKWQGTQWRWLTWYLLFIVLAEAYGKYTRDHHMKEASEFLVNMAVKPLQCLFAFFLFFRNAERREKWLPIALCAIYLPVWVSDVAWHKTAYIAISPTVGNLMILVLSLQFLLRLATSGDILHFKTNMFFWVVTGYLIFYLGGLPYLGLYNYLVQYHRDIFYAYRLVFLLLSSTMYVLFSVGFLCARKSSHS